MIFSTFRTMTLCGTCSSAHHTVTQRGFYNQRLALMIKIASAHWCWDHRNASPIRKVRSSFAQLNHLLVDALYEVHGKTQTVRRPEDHFGKTSSPCSSILGSLFFSFSGWRATQQTATALSLSSWRVWISMCAVQQKTQEIRFTHIMKARLGYEGTLLCTRRMIRRISIVRVACCRNTSKIRQDIPDLLNEAFASFSLSTVPDSAI